MDGIVTSQTYPLRRLGVVVGCAALAALWLALGPEAGAQDGDAGWPTYVATEGNTWQSGQRGPADPGLRWYRDFSEPRPEELSFAPEGYSLAVGSRHRGMPIEVGDLVVMRATNNDAQHDQNANSVIGVDASDGTVQWEIPNAFAQMGACEPAVDSSGRLWVPTWRGGLTGGFDGIAAYSLDDGSELFSVEREGVCGATSLHIAGEGTSERLIIYGNGGAAHNGFALDVSTSTPTVAWELAGLGEVEIAGVPNWGTGGSSRSIPRPGVATDDSLIIPVHRTADAGLDLLEIDLANGFERSRAPMPVPSFDPDLDDEQIVASSYDRWQLMMADDDTRVVGPWDNGASQGPDAFVAAFDVAGGLSGQPTWFLRTPGEDVPGRLSLGDGVVLVQPGGSGPIHGLDVATGNPVWESPIHAETAGNVNIVDSDGAIYTRRRADGAVTWLISSLSSQGQERWTIHPDAVRQAIVAQDPGVSDPDDVSYGHTDLHIGMIDAAGTLYAASDQGDWLAAFDSSGGLAPTPEQPDDRLAGANRIETAVQISQQFSEADTVVIARSDDYPDALAGAPLATSLDAPILLTPPHQLASSVAVEVQRLGATEARLLGGTAALSTAVEAGLQQAGVTSIQRYAGSNRFETATQIAADLPDPSGRAFLVQGQDPDPQRGWPDAVAVSALAAFEQSPILLTQTDQMPAETVQTMMGPIVEEAAIIGGEAVVSASVEAELGAAIGELNVLRISGPDRYSTSALVTDAAVVAGMDPSTTWIATGRDFPDSLAAAPLVASAAPTVATDGGVLLLVDGVDLSRSPASEAWVGNHAASIDAVRAIGGTAVITTGVLAELQALAGAQ